MVVLTLPDAGSCGQVPRRTSVARVCLMVTNRATTSMASAAEQLLAQRSRGECCPGARSTASARLPSGLAGRSTYGTTTSISNGGSGAAPGQPDAPDRKGCTSKPATAGAPTFDGS